MKESHKVILLPKQQKILTDLGERIRMARLRRRIPVNVLAERARISRATLWKVEKGDPGVAIGIYVAVLHGIGSFEKDLNLVAKDDIMGQMINDLHIQVKRRVREDE